MQTLKASLLVATVALLGIPIANAGTTEIEMLNKRAGESFVYSSDLVRIDTGDSVTFVPTTKGHNVQSIQGMRPDGAEEIELGFNRSEEHTSELQSLMRSSYAVFCLKKKKTRNDSHRSRSISDKLEHCNKSA